MKIICVGQVTYDITFPCDIFPKENTKTRYHEKEEFAGGSVTIAAFLLSKWGIDTSLAGLIGNDEYGRKIKKELTLNSINTKNLIIDENINTSHSFILANRSNGEKTILTYTPKNVYLKPFDLDTKPDIILIDGHEYEASRHLVQKYKDAITIIDANRDKKEVIELASLVKHVVCSKEFAEKVSGIKIDFENRQTILDAFKYLENKFKNNIVITLAKEGCVYRYNNQIKIMPALKVKTIDSTAAGDIFHGAFVYGLAQNFNFEKIIKYANIAGALSVTRIGGYSSIPTLDEMKEVYGQVK